MTEGLNSQVFTERLFHEKSAEVAAKLVAAGSKAHDWSMAAQHGSGRSTGEPYGVTFWKALPEEVGLQLSEALVDARLYRPRGAQYSLILWGETLVLPVKIKPRGKRDPRPRITTSHVRKTLTRVNMPNPPAAHLFVSDEAEALHEFEEAAVAVVEQARSELGNLVSKVIIVAYECGRHSGLQMVEVGLGNLDEDGYIDFTDSERLSLAVSAPPAETRPVEVVGDSWHNVAKPTTKLQARSKDVTATGEDESVRNQDGSEKPGGSKDE